MNLRKYKNLRSIHARFRHRNIFMLAAGVSFYAFLSLFPFFILIVFISSLFFKDTAVLDNIQRYIRIFPQDVAEIFQGNLVYILENSEFISVLSFLFLLYFAFKIFSGIELAVNNLYGATGIRKGWFGKLRAFILFLRQCVSGPDHETGKPDPDEIFLPGFIGRCGCRHSIFRPVLQISLVPKDEVHGCSDRSCCGGCPVGNLEECVRLVHIQYQPLCPALWNDRVYRLPSYLDLLFGSHFFARCGNKL
jgi:hypothetical protein